jgi:hypothetical protein
MKYLLLILLLSACHHSGVLQGSGEVAPTPGIFDQPFKPEFYRHNPVIIEAVVQTEEQLDSLCGGPMPKGRKRLGCARIPDFEDQPCVIAYYYNADPGTIEHEKNHCRYGRWHP